MGKRGEARALISDRVQDLVEKAKAQHSSKHGKPSRPQATAARSLTPAPVLAGDGEAKSAPTTLLP